MYEHLTARVKEVIKLANTIAREYEQEYVGTEHVLLAIAREGTGLGAKILFEKGLSEEKLKERIDELIQASLEDTWVFGRLPGTPHFKNVVAIAIEKARELKSKNVCTEHLLLGLLAEKGCVAQQALKKSGVTSRMVEQRITKATASV